MIVLVCLVVLVAAAVGLSEVMIQAYWQAEFSDLVPFALLAAMLVFKPQLLSPEAETLPIVRPLHLGDAFGLIDGRLLRNELALGRNECNGAFERSEKEAPIGGRLRHRGDATGERFKAP